jgi:hypothetical protein
MRTRLHGEVDDEVDGEVDVGRTFAELTGRVDGPPLVAPDAVVERMRSLGRSLDLDPRPLVAERATAAGGHRRGSINAGGEARLLEGSDGWLAVNLARPDDRDAVPAWLERAVDDGEVWPVVTREVRARATAPLVERATLLGLPVAAIGSVRPRAVDDALGGLPVGHVRWPSHDRRGATPVVVDLSSLWAGPLCSRLLADRGARVIDVESVSRPDTGRFAIRAFGERLHAGKESVSIDLHEAADVARLAALIRSADVVIESTRPRGLAQHGIDARRFLVDQPGPRAWVSITGYGRADPRVAFGDDAAAAGGLVAWDDDGPCFAYDAVADPLTGITAAAAVEAALARPGRWLIDVALASVAAFVAGPDQGARWAPWTPST